MEQTILQDAILQRTSRCYQTGGSSYILVCTVYIVNPSLKRFTKIKIVWVTGFSLFLFEVLVIYGESS